MGMKKEAVATAVIKISPIILPAKPKRMVAPNQKRDCKSKSRTGCMTCKTRRVKCDERKPFCLQCQKSDFTCEGYILPVKLVNGHAVWQLGRGPRRLATPAANPPWAPLDKTEVGYFDLFRHQLIHDLAGYNQQDFWGRIVLCEIARDECVRHSVVALGALSQALFFVPEPTDNVPSATRPLPLQAVLNDHHKAAVRHHTLAIQMFRDRIAAGKANQSARSIMIMTLLLVTFEFLQGNMKAADRLMVGGIQTLRGELQVLREASNQTKRKISSGDELEDVEHMLPRLSVASSVTHFCDLQSRQFADLQNTGVGELPDANCSTSLPRLFGLWSDFSTRVLIFVCQSFRNQLLRLQYDIAEAEKKQLQLLLRLRQWRDLIDKYHAKARSEPLRSSLQMLIPHWLTLYIFTNCVLDPTDLSYDHFEPEFREINARCAKYLSIQARNECCISTTPMNNKIKFSLGDGLITPLAVVIGKCRAHDVRMEAAEMFRLLPREGAWDAQALIIGKLGLVLMEEKARALHGYVPSQSRWFWTGGEWDFGNRKLHSRYVRIVPAVDGSQVRREMTLDLDSLPDICGEVGCTKNHSFVPRDLMTTNLETRF